LWGSCQGEPRCKGRKLFILGPRRPKRSPKLGHSLHQSSALETENLRGAVQKFLFFDCEIQQATTSACMEKCFAEKFPVRRVNQCMRSENLLQPRKRSAGSKQQAAPREFHSLFLCSRFKLLDRAVSQPPRLGLHPRDKFARLPGKHFLCRVIRLTEFVRESLDEVDALARQNNWRAFFKTNRHSRGPPGMYTKPDRRLF